VQAPAEHVPCDWNVLALLTSTQYPAGGVLQITPVQGVPEQTPPAHPDGQTSACDAYEQRPVAQVPGDWNTVRVLTFAQ
jgi:hypothetical protein